jgi:pimeloyl-ACP methyl ester carboxylesterase
VDLSPSSATIVNMNASDVPNVIPFRQGRFEDLPEKPIVPHVYNQTTPLNIEVSTAELGTMDVHVRRYGSGPPLLLVHGLMTSSYSWRYVFQALGEHFTCYAPDLPANGRSQRITTPAFTPLALARWLREVQIVLGIRGCPVIGNSMGGYLAMTLALDDPQAMSCLINLHSPGVPEPRILLLSKALAIPGVQDILRWAIRRRPLAWAHRHVHYYKEQLKSLEEAREYGELLGTFEGAQGLIKYLAETMNIKPMQQFQHQLIQRKADGISFPVPLLLLYAEHDPMVPARFGAIFAERIPDAQLLWLKNASHFAHVDAVDQFLPPTLDFLLHRQTH